MKSDKTLSYIYDWAGISIWNINKVMIKYGTIRINGRQDASNLMYYRRKKSCGGGKAGRGGGAGEGCCVEI